MTHAGQKLALGVGSGFGALAGLVEREHHFLLFRDIDDGANHRVGLALFQLDCPVVAVPRQEPSGNILRNSCS